MRRIPLTVLLAVSLVGFVRAQEETGDKAEEVKKEILKLEDEKLAATLGSSTENADWFERNDADDIAYTFDNGSTPTKPVHDAQIRSGEVKVLSMKQGGFHVRVYGNGTMAVVSYWQRGSVQFNGKAHARDLRPTDVWHKFPDGRWRRIAHSLSSVSNVNKGVLYRDK